ncbi:RNA polymerase sigma-70 factor (ECF subfamily) [Rhodoligotrophos appendicifer]|uniref:sigma-70 family RNA polymerase sigma factor n=1 Tax=Rhodoligotrophos appendicifer TaxID=987056 RepID=UPI0011803986|nr:sigma-70 family RNA polymerase sigma factor [Rhodoligotrophos appendicifer]
MTPTPSPKQAEKIKLTAALQRCSRRDQAALREIYDVLAPRMLGVALRMLRRRDLAEDVVHDAFLKIWEGAASFDPERGDPSTWMFAILRHRALNLLRNESRTDLVHDDQVEDQPAEEPDAEALVVALSEASALRRCLDNIEPARRQAIVLAYTHGLSHGELAGRLRVPLGTIKSWIRRSLVALRECMA